MTSNKIPGIAEQYGEQILKLFENLPQASEVLLFGSRAKGNYREGSDIDLAIKNDKITLENRNQWLIEYENLFLPWKLDLVVYHLITEPDLKDHIDRVGISIIKK